MGNAQTNGKVKDFFGRIGEGVKNAWGKVKDFGENAWNKIKSVPVIGSIASGIEKYTPIGWAASGIKSGIDAGVNAGNQVLHGDLKGALKTGIDYARERVNYENPLLTKIKSIPVIGKVASGLQSAAEMVPIYGGLSASQLKGIANKGLDSADSFRQGDVGGGFKNLAGAGLTAAQGGALGKTAGRVASVLGKANDVAKVF